MGASTSRLIEAVTSRQRLIAIGQRFYWVTLIAAGVYAVLLILSRGLGLIPDWFTPWTSAAWQVGLIPVVGLLAGLAFHRRPRRSHAAHLIDERIGAKDLFLTALMLDRSPGEYKPIVTDQAEGRAAGVRASAVLPLNLWPRGGHVVMSLAVLLAGATWMPQLDPFGHRAEQIAQQEQIEQIKKQQVTIKKQLDALASKPLTAKTSEQTKKAIDDLLKTFGQLKPRDPQSNLRQLQEQQKRIGQKWRRVNEELKRQTAQQQVSPSFSTLDRQTRQQWEDQMSEGSTRSLEKELQELQKMAQQLAEEDDPAKQQQLKQQMTQKLQNLQNFTQQNATTPQLQQSLQQAMQQVQNAGGNSPQSQQQNQALQQQLQLAQKQTQQMGQMVRDQQALQQALQTIQQAKQAQQQGQQGQPQTLQDYQKMYSQMMQQQGQQGQQGQQPCQSCSGQGCQSCNGTGKQPGSQMAQGQGRNQGTGQQAGALMGQGGGMGQRGQGEGGTAPEDSSVQTGFQSEKARTHLQAGEILMEMKIKETPTAGTATVDHAKLVEEVQQGVSEAITQERVPPGHHDAIKGYFDTMRAEAARETGTSNSSNGETSGSE